jgi:hypothetical protein
MGLTTINFFGKFMKGKHNGKGEKNITKGKWKNKAFKCHKWWSKPLCEEMSSSSTLG